MGREGPRNPLAYGSFRNIAKSGTALFIAFSAGKTETSDFLETKFRGFTLKVRMFPSRKSDVFRRKEGEKTIPFPRFGAFSRYFTPEVRSSYPKTTEGRVSEWAEMAAKTPKSTLERSPDLVKIILGVCIFLTFRQTSFRVYWGGVCNRSGGMVQCVFRMHTHRVSAPLKPPLYTPRTSRNRGRLSLTSLGGENSMVKQQCKYHWNSGRRTCILSFPHIQNKGFTGILPPFSTVCAGASFPAPRNCLYLQRDWGIPAPTTGW